MTTATATDSPAGAVAGTLAMQIARVAFYALLSAGLVGAVIVVAGIRRAGGSR